MKKPLSVIIALLMLALLGAGIHLISQVFNDVVNMEPARLIKQCELPAELEPQIESALHDTNLGTVQVQLKAKPSEFNLREMFLTQKWRFNEEENSYCNSSLKVHVDEQESTLFIE